MKISKTIIVSSIFLLALHTLTGYAKTPHIVTQIPDLPTLFLQQHIAGKNDEVLLFTHGQPGALLLNGKWESGKSLATSLKKLVTGKTCAIRIFGCNFGKGAKGRQAVAYLQQALNVTVSASDDITGKNGDWILEAGEPYALQGLESYAFNLQCGGITGGTSAGDDFDGDGICNDVDMDDDNDGVPDATERSTGGTPLYLSFWEVKVYDYPPEDAFVLHSSGNFGPLTQAASGTMMGASNSLDLNWINASTQTNVLPSLNENGGNVNGSNPSTINYAVYFVHTFTNNDAGWYTIQQGTLYDGKHIYKTKTNGTDSTVFESTDWTVSNTTVNIYFEPGSKLNLFIWENGNSNARAVINIRPSAGQQFYADIDTDNDGFPNYLDLDSDGDGCNDAYEAGATANTANNYQFTGAVGTNGLVNSLETTTDNGIINYTSTYSLYAVYKFLNLCADTDGDGIPDVFEDIDDDGDGIPDAAESPACFYTAAEANSIFKISSGFTSTDDDQTDGDIQLLHDADAATKSFNFNDYTTAQNPTGSNLFTIAYSTSVRLATLVVSDNISSTANANAVVTGSNDGVTWSAALSPATVITTTPVTFAIGTNQAYKYYRIETGSVAGALATGNTIGEITSTLASGYNPSEHPKNSCFADADGDNIINVLDLDSDGDGCSDAREAGATTSTTPNYQFTGADANGNGLVDAVENGTTGTVNYVSTYKLYATYKFLNLCLDTDGDGVPDFGYPTSDVDDDNDGALNATEAPGCYYTAAEANTIASITSALTSPDDNQTDGDIQMLHNGALTTYDFNFDAGQPINGSALFIVKYPAPVVLASMTINNNLSFGASTTARLQGSVDSVTWVDASASVSLATTANKVFTVTNNNPYLYYRILGDGGAATTITTTTIAEITTALASSYNPSAHPKNTCNVDTDGDGLTNNRDLDSDGDGCSDAKEAGATSSNTGNYQFSGTDANGNGLIDIIENGTTGTINYISTYSLYARYSFLSLCSDFDADGVADLTDIDDDNDGAPDATEAPACYYTATEATVPASISTGMTSTINAVAVTPGADISTMHDGITTSASASNHVIAAAGASFVGATLYTVQYKTPVNLSSLSVTGSAVSWGTGTTATLYGSNDSATWTPLMSTALNTAVTTVPKTFTVNQNAAQYRYYQIRGTAGTGAAITNYEVAGTLNAASYNPSAHPKTPVPQIQTTTG